MEETAGSIPARTTPATSVSDMGSQVKLPMKGDPTKLLMTSSRVLPVSVLVSPLVQRLRRLRDMQGRVVRFH